MTRGSNGCSLSLAPLSLAIRIQTMGWESIWMIIVGISAPVAGVVAFFIQLNNLKKINLENEKLQLEVARLKEENRALERKIKIPTNEEIKQYGRPDIMFARRSLNPPEKQTPLSKIKDLDWGSLILAIFIIGFIAYFFYDIYRLGAWLISMF